MQLLGTKLLAWFSRFCLPTREEKKGTISVDWSLFWLTVAAIGLSVLKRCVCLATREEENKWWLSNHDGQTESWKSWTRWTFWDVSHWLANLLGSVLRMNQTILIDDEGFWAPNDFCVEHSSEQIKQKINKFFTRWKISKFSAYSFLNKIATKTTCVLYLWKEEEILKLISHKRERKILTAIKNSSFATFFFSFCRFE